MIIPLIGLIKSNYVVSYGLFIDKRLKYNEECFELYEENVDPNKILRTGEECGYPWFAITCIPYNIPGKVVVIKDLRDVDYNKNINLEKYINLIKNDNTQK